MSAAKTPTSDLKSGISQEAYATQHGGYPDKKDQEAIAKANSPKKAPNSVRV